MDDLISRKALLAELRALDPPGFENSVAGKVAIKKIKEAPAVSQQSRWIPITEKLPDLIPCDAGTAYSEAVNVLTEGRKVLTAIWNGTYFICDEEFWEAWGEKITHWTPVLLPLPKPPKEKS